MIKDIISQIKNYNYSQVLEYIEKKCGSKDSKAFLVTINPEIIMLARDDEEYEKVLESADLAVCDGIGVVWAGKMFGKKFNGRVHGVDLVEKVCEFVAKKPITVGFLGGDKNVALNTSDCLRKKYPGLQVSFADSKFEIRNSKFEIPKTDILFVAFGSPKQEKWIYENLAKIDVKVAVGVGGAFDFISGQVRRAPKWMRKLGLEWLFRLIIQPWRWKRQLALPKFIYLVFKERLVLT
jgi:N-acetylglucosaminyldiphosphoundecaprenol N-acetyl-beta-D-mannosaminyltransferase